MASGSQRNSERNSQHASQRSLRVVYTSRQQTDGPRLSDSSEDESAPIPSNQLAVSQTRRQRRERHPITTDMPHGSRDYPEEPQQQPEEEEEESWNFLTQFIGSPAASSSSTSNDNVVETANLEAANFRLLQSDFI